jgi:hypothetical protein
MTLHAYKESEAGEQRLLVGLELSSLELLQPAFDVFEKLTGVRISEYDDVRLPPQHAALLAAQINLHTQQAIRLDANIRKFHDALQGASRDGYSLFLEAE